MNAPARVTLLSEGGSSVDWPDDAPLPRIGECIVLMGSESRYKIFQVDYVLDVDGDQPKLHQVEIVAEYEE